MRMFEWGHSQQILCFRSPGNCRVTRIRFNHQGNKVRSKAFAWFQNSRRHIPRFPPVLPVSPVLHRRPPELRQLVSSMRARSSPKPSSLPELPPHYLFSPFTVSFSESSLLSSFSLKEKLFLSRGAEGLPILFISSLHEDIDFCLLAWE